MTQLMAFFMATTLSIPAFAKTEKTIDCTGDETPEWTITGTFGGGTIEFFDNDSWSTFTYWGDLESFPVQMIYNELGSQSEAQISIRGITKDGQTETVATYSDKRGTTEKFSCTIGE